MLKKFLPLLLMAALFWAVGCSSEKPAETKTDSAAAPAAAEEAKEEAKPVDDKVYTLRIGDITAPGDVLNVSLEEMAKAINEKSGGRLKASVASWAPCAP